MSEQTTIKWLYPGDDLTDAYAIRSKVFIEEQNVPPELEMDEIDSITDHVVLYTKDNIPVATGRIVWEEDNVTLGRIAVLQLFRGSGYGALVVQQLVDKVFAKGFSEVHLHSQTHAVGFYEKLGFIPYGGIYEDAGIPHRSMVYRKS